MAVTVDASSIVGGGSGLTGWSARSTFLIENVGDYFQGAPNNSVYLGDKQAQSFLTTSTYSASGVVLNLIQNGTPSDNWFVTIEADSSGSPSGTPLATSQNINASTDVAGANKNVLFTFASPPSLTNATTYWIVLNRSGATDGTNQLRWALNDSGVSGVSYASGGIKYFSGSWTDPGSQYDNYFIVLKTTKAVYQVTQDAELHMWQSTNDGTSWSELDAGNGPTVNSSTKPFSACHRWDCRGSGPTSQMGVQGIWCGYFSNTNTGRVRRFDLATGLWATTDIAGADASTDVDFNRNIRVSSTSYDLLFWYTSVADDADLEFAAFDGVSWSANQVMAAITSTESSQIVDVVTDRTFLNGTTRWHAAFHYDVNADDFQVRSTNFTSQGTALDIDAAAADVETEHHSAVYQTYSGAGSVDTVIAAYIDADGSIEERTAQLEVTSASITLGTQHAVGTSTSYLGRSLATCKYGSDLYIFAGTGSAIDVYVDRGATGTWDAGRVWLTGLTNAVLSTAVPITNVGVLVSYVDNADTKVNLLALSLPTRAPINLRNNVLLRR
jgi:hypothetical protein